MKTKWKESVEARLAVEAAAEATSQSLESESPEGPSVEQQLSEEHQEFLKHLLSDPSIEKGSDLKHVLDSIGE